MFLVSVFCLVQLFHVGLGLTPLTLDFGMADVDWAN